MKLRFIIYTIEASQLQKCLKDTEQTSERLHSNIRLMITRIQLKNSYNRLPNTDQLKSATIKFHFQDNIHMTLPIQFRNVRMLKIYGCGKKYLSVQLSECLHHLRLERVTLDPNFDWTQLKGLTRLYVKGVSRMNAQNFIALLRYRPNLQVFHHDNVHTVDGSMQDICDAVAKYCGNQIQDYAGVMPRRRPLVDDDGLRRHLYDFISEFKNVKKVCLTTHQHCGSDLLDGIQRLAATIETIHIQYSHWEYWGDERNAICRFQQRENPRDLGLFIHLKTFSFSWKKLNYFDTRAHGDECDSFKLLNSYSLQILWNVEDLEIDSVGDNMDFIKFALNLRHLKLFIQTISTNRAIKILSHLASILSNRNNGVCKSKDFIEIMFKRQFVFEVFSEVNGHSDSIRLFLDSDGGF